MLYFVGQLAALDIGLKRVDNAHHHDVSMFAGLGHRSPMAGAGDGDLSGEKMAGDILDSFLPSVNYSNLAGIRTNYSG